MPFAKPIPSHWPPSLFDDADQDDVSSAWSALQVRPRAEKAVSKRLMGLDGIGYFLPYSEHERRYQRRRVTVQELLFPGYIFAFGQHDVVRSSVCALSGVVQHLEEPDQSSLRNSLVALNQVLTAGLPVTTEDRLEPGMAVEITGGPFVGHRGLVIENKKALRFVIQLDFIQRAVSVSVDGSMVKAI